MTRYGETVARELRSAVIPVEMASILDHRELPTTIRALLKNALFWVVPTPTIEAERDRALLAVEHLSHTIASVGVHPQGISLAVDGARSDAIVAFDALIDAVADAEPTQSGKSLGIG